MQIVVNYAYFCVIKIVFRDPVYIFKKTFLYKFCRYKQQSKLLRVRSEEARKSVK